MKFVHDFTLLVADIHQIMLISLFPTPFDHFHGSAGLVPKLILTLRHMLNLISILTLTFVSEKKVLPPYLIQSGFFGHLGQSLPNDKNFRTLLPNLKLMEPDNKEAVLDRRTQSCTYLISLTSGRRCCR